MDAKKNGTPVAWAAPTAGQRAADGAPNAHPRVDLADGFWKDVPVLSWLMNPENGELQFHPSPSGNGSVDVSVRHDVLAAALLRKVQRDGANPVRMTEVLSAADGGPRHVLIVGFPVEGASPPCLAGVAIDITDQKVRVDELAQQALVDGLTGLYNLRGFFLFAEHELKVARRRGTQSAIVYADVDGLKQINDTKGHEQGSAMLVATAELLRHVFRECDVIGRLGGDEFAIFASDVRGDPELLIQRLYRAIAQQAAAEGAEVLSVSAGVGSFPPDPDLRLTDLLNAADQAMYQNKLKKRERAEPLNSSGGIPS